MTAIYFVKKVLSPFLSCSELPGPHAKTKNQKTKFKKLNNCKERKKYCLFIEYVIILLDILRQSSFFRFVVFVFVLKGGFSFSFPFWLSRSLIAQSLAHSDCCHYY